MGRLYEYDLRERRENVKPVHKKPKMSEGKAKHVNDGKCGRNRSD